MVSGGKHLKVQLKFNDTDNKENKNNICSIWNDLHLGEVYIYWKNQSIFFTLCSKGGDNSSDCFVLYRLDLMDFFFTQDNHHINTKMSVGHFETDLDTLWHKVPFCSWEGSKTTLF